MKTKWEKLLCEDRYEGDSYLQTGRTGFERDFDRIVFSTAFRRLQNKTQVMSLPEEDFVHNRLTHSLEAACVGRSLGKIVGNQIVERHGLDKTRAFHFSDIVAAATLAHDIGNPPFGHSGEDAISEFFKDENNKDYLEGLTESQKADLQNFEGNALGFRLLTHTFVANSSKKGGLQLTYATLGTFSKYPKECLPISEKKDNNASGKKYGFFQSENEAFWKIATRLELIKKQGERNAWHRHPLAFLVEAADDICYRVMDLEDGYKLKFLDFNEVKDLLLEKGLVQSGAFNEKDQKNYSLIHHDRTKIEFLRAKFINHIIDRVSKVFLDNEEEILDGSFDKPLIELIPEAGLLKKIETISVKKYYNCSSNVETEAAGFKVIEGLLGAFLRALYKPQTKYSKKILQLIPSQYFDNDRKKFDDKYQMIINIIGYVASMTDTYAIDLFRKIYGISLPNY